MTHGTRPAAEVAIDVHLVRRLLAAQFPQWAASPLERVDSPGWDNTIYRLGADLAVRLPRRAFAATQPDREHQWLPMLAPRLPLAVPAPVGKGVPGEGYPWRWTVCRWLPGDNAMVQPVADLGQATRVLARFVAALQAINPAGGPASRYRGVPLAGRDRMVRASIAALQGALHAAPVTAAWESAVAAPAWQRPGVWMHGDLHPANLLVHRGELSGVLDFGLLAVGDPACDLMVAWTFLPAASREDFKAMLSVDDATWARARGWALETGLRCAAHSAESPLLGRIGRHTVNEVLSDYGWGQ